jgi:hypothetical protein
MAAQAQPTQDLTLSEKMKIVQYLSILPAITIMVFMRRKVGFRMLKPSWLIGMACFLWFIDGICNTNILIFSPCGFIFSDFPWVMLIAAFFQRYLRWRDLCNGKRWHTYSPGISYFELLPLPKFLKAHRRIYRFIDPLACFVFAMYFGVYFSRPLARWIAFSSLALFIYEQALFEKQLDRDLDILDGLVAAEVQTETVEHFAGPQPQEVQRTLEETAGIPTGVAFDIHRQIEKRRAQQAMRPEKMSPDIPLARVVQVSMVAAPDKLAAPPPDNMVKETPENPV